MEKPQVKRCYISPKTGEMMKLTGSRIAIRRIEYNLRRAKQVAVRIPLSVYEKAVVPIGETVREIGAGATYCRQRRKFKRLKINPAGPHVSKFVTLTKTLRPK